MSRHTFHRSKFPHKIMFDKRKCMPGPVADKHAKIGLFVQKSQKKSIFFKKYFWGKFYTLFSNGNTREKMCSKLDTLRLPESP
jgi:hypothetical protein